METVEFYYSQAKNFYNNKDYTHALESIQKAITIDNRNFNCWSLITEIYLDLNRIEEASSCAITLINLDVNNSHAWYLRTRVLIGFKRYDEALIASNKSLELNNTNYKYQKLNNNIKEFLDFRTNKNSTTVNNSSVNNKTTEKKTPQKEKIFNPINKYESIFKVISSSNIQLFKDKKLNSEIYYNLLDNVMEDVLKKIDKNSKAHIYNKITQFVSYFAEIQYESIDNADGLYSCNVIKIDRSGKITKTIAILIHELAHHLLSEIFELYLMYLFNSKKTDAIEAFAWYVLNFKEEYLLMNEYCAHTVENYFMPFQYNNYGSFNRVLKKFNLSNREDIEKINFATKLGNTFAQDIIYMLNKYFDDNLKKEIKKQFILDGCVLKIFEGTKFKTNDFFNDEMKFDKINAILIESIIYIRTHFGLLELLKYKRIFRKVNKR